MLKNSHKCFILSKMYKTLLPDELHYCENNKSFAKIFSIYSVFIYVSNLTTDIKINQWLKSFENN